SSWNWVAIVRFVPLMTIVLEPAGWDAGLTEVRVEVWIGAEHWEAQTPHMATAVGLCADPGATSKMPWEGFCSSLVAQKKRSWPAISAPQTPLMKPCVQS